MGRYFGREPRYSQDEAEAQAKAALDAAMQKGRPPVDEWRGLASRTGDLSRELATRPPVEIPPPPPPRRAEPGRPRVVSQILRPRPDPAAEPSPVPPVIAPPAPAPRAQAAKSPAGRAGAATTRTPRASAAAATSAKRVAPAAAPAKRVSRGSAAGAAKESAPVKRSTRTTEPPAPGAAKRPATKKRPG